MTMPVRPGGLGKATQMKALMQLLRAVPAALLSIAKWGLPLLFVYFLYLSLDKIVILGRGIGSLIGWSSKPAKPLPERVADQKDKCRAYTMLANFSGAKERLEQDRIRVLCTVIRLEETGVDACDIFKLQMELVPPGWGRRETDVYNPILKRNVYVPLRREIWIEGEFSTSEKDAAILLGLRTKDQKLCPADWTATTIVRPVREKTLGNQRDKELAAIRKMVPQKVSGPPSEFEFFSKAP